MTVEQGLEEEDIMDDKQRAIFSSDEESDASQEAESSKQTPRPPMSQAVALRRQPRSANEKQLVQTQFQLQKKDQELEKMRRQLEQTKKKSHELKNEVEQWESGIRTKDNPDPKLPSILPEYAEKLREEREERQRNVEAMSTDDGDQDSDVPELQGPSLKTRKRQRRKLANKELKYRRRHEGQRETNRTAIPLDVPSSSGSRGRQEKRVHQPKRTRSDSPVPQRRKKMKEEPKQPSRQKHAKCDVVGFIDLTARSSEDEKKPVVIIPATSKASEQWR